MTRDGRETATTTANGRIFPACTSMDVPSPLMLLPHRLELSLSLADGGGGGGAEL